MLIQIIILAVVMVSQLKGYRASTGLKQIGGEGEYWKSNIESDDNRGVLSFNDRLIDIYGKTKSKWAGFSIYGFRHCSYSSLFNVNSIGNCWLSSADSSILTYNLGFFSGHVLPQNGNCRAYGFSITRLSFP